MKLQFTFRREFSGLPGSGWEKVGKIAAGAAAIALLGGLASKIVDTFRTPKFEIDPEMMDEEVKRRAKNTRVYDDTSKSC